MRVVGSWSFIIAQTTLLAAWMALNVVWVAGAFDGFPFVLLNLALSTQAAFATPILLMAQNRASERDRRVLYGDYKIGAQTKLMIENIINHLDSQGEEIDGIVAELARHRRARHSGGVYALRLPKVETRGR